MHDYSLDKHPKEKIIFLLTFAAIASAPLINRGLLMILDRVGVELGWAQLPALAIPTFSLFALLYAGFNKYLWRVSWLRKFLLVPDLNGTWQCQGRTVLKDGQPSRIEWAGKITITQSWSKILVHLQAGQSSSKSVAASIQHVDETGYTLLYQYVNSPRAGEHDLAIHSGAAEIHVSADSVSGQGHYFTDQHRSTVGTMTISKD